MKSKEKNSGWVYILTNPSMPDLVKIGLTQRTPHDRAADLSRQTNMPTAFKVFYAVQVINCFALEAKIHERLAKYRVNNQREFFRLTGKAAQAKVEIISKEYKKNQFSPVLQTILACIALIIVILSAIVYFFGLDQVLHYPAFIAFSKLNVHINFILLVGILIVLVFVFTPKKKKSRRRR